MLPLYSLIYSSVLRIHSDSDFLILALPIPLVFTILVEEGPTNNYEDLDIITIVMLSVFLNARWFIVRKKYLKLYRFTENNKTIYQALINSFFRIGLSIYRYAILYQECFKINLNRTIRYSVPSEQPSGNYHIPSTSSSISFSIASIIEIIPRAPFDIIDRNDKRRQIWFWYFPVWN